MRIFTEKLETLRTSFLESLRIRNQSPTTLLSRNDAVATFYLWLSKEEIEDVREVTRQHIGAYQHWLMQAHSYSMHTIHNKITGIRRFFEYLENTDTILLNPCVGIILPKLEKRLPLNVLTKEEARRLLDAPDTQTKRGIRDKAILELLYSTGIRRQEIGLLTLHDVDTRNGFVRINKGKFAKDRVVPMGGKASDYIAEYITKVRSHWSQHQKEERALWLRSQFPHQPMHKDSIAILIKHYKKLTQIQCPGCVHLWRHTCATHMVQSGANIAYVQRLLGHRRLSTTQIYTRVTVPEVKEVLHKRHPRARAGAASVTVAPDKIKSTYGK